MNNNKVISFITTLKSKSLKTKIIFSSILGVLISAILFYIFLPPINLMAEEFWIYLTAVIASFALPFLNLTTKRAQRRENESIISFEKISFNKWVLIAIAAPLVILIIGSIISSTFFNAKRYASIIEVKESDFATDLPETTEITNIALMDTASARILGARTLGSLSDVVSQYTLREHYTQINYQNTPKKVTNLEYDGFFKWLGNKDKGVPGMVIVDPVKSSSEYIKFDEPMHYVESAYFNQDLERKLRFLYPTKIFESISFELDENGKPYYIVACAKPQVMLFGARDIEEIIIFDPTTGTGELYPASDAPSWIDIVYDGNLATEKFNWQGMLSGGYINSIIGNVGCKQATDDFGYIVIGDDVWYFTGVTSAVSNDKSNIGFILTNARTGEYKFYPVIGAEEHSAMAAAEGEVQEKGYIASFPSLVNISGQATYIMVLKDAAGLVKLYALVNVENYSIVATGATQADAMSTYKKLLRQSDIEIGDPESSVDITVEDVRIAMVSNVATVYITATDGSVFKGYLEADEALVLIRKGDSLKINYAKSEIDKLFIISSWSFTLPPTEE